LNHYQHRYHVRGKFSRTQTQYMWEIFTRQLYFCLLAHMHN